MQQPERGERRVPGDLGGDDGDGVQGCGMIHGMLIVTALLASASVSETKPDGQRRGCA